MRIVLHVFVMHDVVNHSKKIGVGSAGVVSWLSYCDGF